MLHSSVKYGGFRHVAPGKPLPGHSLLKPVEEISVWAEKNAAFVQKKRQEFEARSLGGKADSGVHT